MQRRVPPRGCICMQEAHQDAGGRGETAIYNIKYRTERASWTGTCSAEGGWDSPGRCRFSEILRCYLDAGIRRKLGLEGNTGPNTYGKQ